MRLSQVFAAYSAQAKYAEPPMMPADAEWHSNGQDDRVSLSPDALRASWSERGAAAGPMRAGVGGRFYLNRSGT